MPPTMVIEPDSDIVHDPRLNLELPCLARGNPTPIYTWTKNHKQSYELVGQNSRIVMTNNSGTLYFNQLQKIDQGWYQCNATNVWGKQK